MWGRFSTETALALTRHGVPAWSFAVEKIVLLYSVAYKRKYTGKEVRQLGRSTGAPRRLAREVAQSGGAIAITQRSKLSAVLVGTTRYEADMAELEQYRR